MKYKVYLDELENHSDELICYSRTKIRNKIDELKHTIDDIDWNGPAHDAFIEKYNEEINKLYNINEKMSKLGDYLRMSKEKYNETNESLSIAWNELIDVTAGDNK